MNIENYNKILKNLPKTVKLVVVSKFQPINKIQQLYEVGQRLFGENRPLEMRDKYEILPKDIKWHFIGHLQTNKIKSIISFVNVIESVNSAYLLKKVNDDAASVDRIVDVMLEFHIAHEETKQGFSIEEAKDFLASEKFHSLHNVNVIGVMGMATFTDDKNMVRKEFATLKHYFELLKQDFFEDNLSFQEISMGMSEDYPLAVEEGSTIVRIGTAIFGAREYK
ncbi:MAG: YggS family pyridoxal phosphate-dependent enzyme [Bacteroidales bacterium]|nr:YggS family pyridoxal phosphate-dependent enzyme [Bacteroidales bacterium]